ncbi:MAG: hypothetical protein VB099_05700 [Candidatus Limiplasma sp.]|nr:hypothetical protein [Candidatus Limiplasma sp.]
MADEWKYGQQSLRRPGGAPPYRENAPLMRPISGDLLRRWEQREPPVSARLERQEEEPPQGERYSCASRPPWSPADAAQPAQPPQGLFEPLPMVPSWGGYYPPYGVPQGYQPPAPYGYYPYGMAVPYAPAIPPYGQGMPPQGPAQAAGAAPGQSAPPPPDAAPQPQGAFPPGPQSGGPPLSPPPWAQAQPEQSFSRAVNVPSFSDPAPAPQPAPSPILDDEEDWEDEEMGGFGAAPQGPLPSPATIPLSVPTTESPKKGKGGLAALLLTVLLLGSAGAVYFTGILDPQLASVSIPTWNEMKDRLRASEEEAAALPQATPVQGEAQALEQALAAPQAGIQPASEALATLKAFDVSFREAQAPATLVFSLQTNAAVNDIRLLLPSNEALPVRSVKKVPTGDGITWQLLVDFQEPFEGEIRAFLRYDASVWAPGGLSCSVAVKAP